MLAGLIQSLFEGSMYTFVLLWAPVMKIAASNIGWGVPPFGLIFACYMVGCMMGSTFFGMAMGKGMAVEKISERLLLVASLSLFFGAYFIERYVTVSVCLALLMYLCVMTCL